MIRSVIITALCASTLFSGCAIPRSPEEHLFRAEAERGNAKAQHNLGVALAGWDNKEAIFWWRKAAEQGLAQSQFNLGWAYDHGGKGVERDSAQAVLWYRKAAEQGYDAAQTNLGLLYHEGRGVEQDDDQAMYWYRKAAAQSDSVAQGNIREICKTKKQYPECS